MSTRNERHIATVNEVLAAGQGSKAFIKRGTEALNWIYEAEIKNINWHERGVSIWDIPFNLHQVREVKHKEVMGDVWPRVAELVEMRNAIKAMPIITRQPKVETPEQKIVRTLKEEIERRKEKFDIAKRACELFGQVVFSEKLQKEVLSLPISTYPVYCTNSFGTSWVRIDWYLRGEKTAFNTICAAAEEIMKEKGLR
ncbi:hypothetical protein phiOC_p114 [Ochrobactrum phage vB_OspM_OC]|nr:hypothetical protein phiOC_p114 [Ochrobactrum phage vB_OspM_OC]